MTSLNNTVAVYPDLATSLADWAGVEAAAQVTADESVETLIGLLGGARNTLTRAGATAEDVREALDVDTPS